MLILVRLIGIFVVGAGVIFLLSPKTMRRFMVFCVKGKRLYIGCIFRILIGIIFLSAASQSRIAWVIVTLGILALIGGLTFFILGLERIRSMLRWWHVRSLLVLRLVALIPIAIGVLILYSI
jgi:small-conductance mechanosensitive channel